jgi:hypothetical protein
MMQLVNQIIYGNIYCPPVEVMSEAHPQSPTPSQCILEGVLLLHRGGLASFKWVKYGYSKTLAIPLAQCLFTPLLS